METTMDLESIDLTFPLYYIDERGMDLKPNKNKSPLPCELDIGTGNLNAIVFTSTDAAVFYMHRRGLSATHEVQSISTQKDMYLIAKQLVERFPNVKRFIINPTGIPGPVRSAAVRDVALALRSN